jgi:hypothetical protein
LKSGDIFKKYGVILFLNRLLQRIFTASVQTMAWQLTDRINFDKQLFLALLYCLQMYEIHYERIKYGNKSAWMRILNQVYRSVELYDRVHTHPSLTTVDRGWLMIVCIEV